VAEPVARELHAPLDLIVIRKVGHPLQPELAIGAVSSGGDVVFTEYAAGFSDADLRQWVGATMSAAQELEARIRHGIPQAPIAGMTAIVVDDGIATSATMLCASAAARRRGAARIVCAVPVAPDESLRQVRMHFDDVVVLQSVAHPHFAVGRFYANFAEVSDADVRAALERGRLRQDSER